MYLVLLIILKVMHDHYNVENVDFVCNYYKHFIIYEVVCIYVYICRYPYFIFCIHLLCCIYLFSLLNKFIKKINVLFLLFLYVCPSILPLYYYFITTGGPLRDNPFKSFIILRSCISNSSVIQTSVPYVLWR